jgi:hypothetical protein
MDPCSPEMPVSFAATKQNSPLWQINPQKKEFHNQNEKE